MSHKLQKDGLSRVKSSTIRPIDHYYSLLPPFILKPKSLKFVQTLRRLSMKLKPPVRMIRQQSQQLFSKPLREAMKLMKRS